MKKAFIDIKGMDCASDTVGIERSLLKINKGEEIFRDVKIPGFIGTKEKAFCCDNHANNYKKEVEEHLKRSKGGSCCG